MEIKKFVFGALLIFVLVFSTFGTYAAAPVIKKEMPAIDKVAASQFLFENKGRFGVEPATLSFSAEKSVEGLKLFRYTQTYEGLPVEGSRLDMIFSGSELADMRKEYYENIDAPIQPKIDLERATELALKDLVGSAEIEPVASELVILPKGSKYYLAYKIEFPLIQKPLGRWVVYVDGISGRILEKQNKIIFEDVVMQLDLFEAAVPPVPDGGGGPADITGTVTGMVYPEHTGQPQEEQVIEDNMVSVGTAQENGILFSGSGDNLETYATTSEPIPLVGNGAYLNFDIWGNIEFSYDLGFVRIFNDVDSLIYTFTGSSGGLNHANIDISRFMGSPVYIRFGYVTDFSSPMTGYYVDNLQVDSFDDNGLVTVYKTNFDNELGWELDGFSIDKETVFEAAGSTYANSVGTFAIESNGASHLFSQLEGTHAKIYDTQSMNPSTHLKEIAIGDMSWNWVDDDTSDRQEQTNAFYHANKIYDYFAQDEDVARMMGYQMPVRVNIPDVCNAYYDGYGINFFAEGGGCENTALLSDVIYHEYTHAVIDRIYQGYWDNNEFGAIHEGFADYFAGTVNGNSCMAEGFFEGQDCLRNLENDLRYPDDWAGEVHDDGRIIGAAAWDLRELLGSELADEYILNTLKLNSVKFDDFVGDMLLLDHVAYGDANKEAICTAFYTNHGIGAPYCSPGVNHRPILTGVSDYYGVTVKEALVITPQAYDLDSDELAFTFGSPLDAAGAWTPACGEDGWYSTYVEVSDGILTDRQDFDIEVLPVSGDSDGDCIIDSVDDVLYDGNAVETNLANLGLQINGNSDLNQEFSGEQIVMFYDGTKPVAEFEWNFDEAQLDLLGVGLVTSVESTTGGVAVWNFPADVKTLYLDKKRYGSEICILDKDVDNLGNISSSCTQPGEIKLACPGTVGGYSCSIVNGQYKVSGLTHSGVKEVGEISAPNIPPSNPPSTGGGKKSGGGPRSDTTSEAVTITSSTVPEVTVPSEPEQDNVLITGAATTPVRMSWGYIFVVIVVLALAGFAIAFRSKIKRNLKFGADKK